MPPGFRPTVPKACLAFRGLAVLIGLIYLGTALDIAQFVGKWIAARPLGLVRETAHPMQCKCRHETGCARVCPCHAKGRNTSEASAPDFLGGDTAVCKIAPCNPFPVPGHVIAKLDFHLNQALVARFPGMAAMIRPNPTLLHVPSFPQDPPEKIPIGKTGLST